MSTSAVQSPFSLLPATVDSGTSLSIPLQLKQLPSGGYKVGIEVTLTDPGTGATAEGILYEFDTGGKGFFASIPPALQQQLPLPSPNFGSIYNHYSSGIQYFGNAVYLDVSFPASGNSQSFRMLVGYVNAMSNEKPHPSTEEKQFPIFGYFWGDFGGSLQATQITAPNPRSTTNPPPNTDSTANTISLLTVLEQLPPPFGGSGFVVNLGPHPKEGSAPHDPAVIVGLTKTLREAFPAMVAMNTLSDPTYPPSGQNEPSNAVQTFPEQILNGTLSLNGNALPNPIPIVLDTGAPDTTLHHGPGLPRDFRAQPGDRLTLTVTTTEKQTVTLLDFTVGHDSSVNHVLEGHDKTLGTNQGYINTGIAAFFRQPICFDFEQKKVRFVSAS